MKTKRLMEIEYPHRKEIVDKLEEILKSCDCPYVIFDDVVKYRIYIDKGSNTWKQVIQTINSIYTVKFRYRNDCYIENGKLYNPSFIRM